MKLGQLLSVPLLDAGLALGDGGYRLVAGRKILSLQSDRYELSKGCGGIPGGRQTEDTVFIVSYYLSHYFQTTVQ